MDQVNLTVRICFVGPEVNGGHSLYSHRLSYASDSIRLFDDEMKCRCFIQSLHMFDTANNIQITDTSMLTKECRSM